MTRPDVAFAAALAGFVLLWLGAGLTVFDYPPLVMRLPQLAGMFTVAMCLMIAVAGLKAPQVRKHRRPSSGRFDRPRLTRLLVLTSILPITHVLGYALGLPVFLAVHLTMNGLGWTRSLIAAAVCALLIEAVFVRILGISMPPPWGV